MSPHWPTSPACPPPGRRYPLWWPALRAAGIENILALRGDIPRDADFPSPEHYHYASELIGHIRSLEGGKELCIGAACYPEGTWNVPTGRTISIS